MSTVAYLALPNGGYAGSATMVGPSTAVTAAHVVHNGWPYVVGVLRGPTGALGDDTKPNFGRRMTRDVFDFIVAYSAL
ncbi:hypothetical protein ACFVAV_27495 [Nocardia sp. NPDC057663]|uniref:hypothetical protein n=1 Tax=Nocardia sp. NPDC057663 TaxID=3346201 RepID=UPI003670ABB1